MVRLSRGIWRQINELLSESKILDDYEPATDQKRDERSNLIHAIDEIDRAIRHGSNFWRFGTTARPSRATIEYENEDPQALLSDHGFDSNPPQGTWVSCTLVLAA